MKGNVVLLLLNIDLRERINRILIYITETVEATRIIIIKESIAYVIKGVDKCLS